MKKTRTVLVLVFLLMLFSLVQAKQLAIVADKNSETSNVKAADLTNLLNGKSKTWPDGKAVKIVLRDPSSPDMELVLRRLLNMTPEQAQALIGAHPGQIMVAESDQAILRIVSSTRGTIGIVDLYSLTKDVNVVKIDGKLPFDSGYLLKGN